MKPSKPLLIIFCLGLLIFNGWNDHLKADAPVTPPSLQDTDQIVIHIVRTGWRLKLNADGSGKLIFGSNPFDLAAIPSGAFDFSEIYNSLLLRLQSNPVDASSVGVAFRKSGEKTATTLYTNNEAALIHIFTIAKQRAQPIDTSRFDQLLKNKPFFPQPH